VRNHAYRDCFPDLDFPLLLVLGTRPAPLPVQTRARPCSVYPDLPSSMISQSTRRTQALPSCLRPPPSSLLKFSSKPALRCSPLAVSTDSRPLKTAPSRPDLSHTTVRAMRLAALHPATLRAIVPESTRRHTQVNNTATPPARPCAWDPPTRRANYSSLTYTWLKPGPTIACTRCSCRS
jgi:hypothetical protein